MAPSAQLLTFAAGPRGAAGAEVQRLDRRHVLHGMRAHAHDFYELLMFDEGRGTHVVNGVAHPTSAGSLFFLVPGEAHDCRALAGAGGWLLLLARPLVDSLLPEGLRAARRTVVPLSRQQRSRWYDRIELLVGELAGTAPLREPAIRAHVTLLLVDLLRGLEVPTPHELATARDIVADVLATIDARFASLTPRDVALALHRSPAHLTTFMRKKTGRTLGDCIIERRMAEARTLLVETDEAIESVASLCGYADTSAFTRRFRKVHGVSPGVWRERRRERTLPTNDLVANFGGPGLSFTQG